MILPCRLYLVSRRMARCILCEMCCSCLWKFLERKTVFFFLVLHIKSWWKCWVSVWDS